MILVLLALTGAQPVASEAWKRERFHWALAGETIEHVKTVAGRCGAKVRFVVAVPEAIVSKPFEEWGIQFASSVTKAEKACVLDHASVTKLDYYSQAEADPSH